jgi:hypothetical protein
MGCLADSSMLDIQSVKITESGGPRGYDASKKIKGRKRKVMVAEQLGSELRFSPRVPLCRFGRVPRPPLRRAFMITRQSLS